MSDNAGRIFISYARIDRSRVSILSSKISEGGLTPVWDVQLDPDDEWLKVIDGMISASDAMIVVWTQRSTLSVQVRREIELAQALGIPVLSCRLDAVEPTVGADRNTADLSRWQGNSADTNWQRLLAKLYERLGRAEEWEARSRLRDDLYPDFAQVDLETALAPLSLRMPSWEDVTSEARKLLKDGYQITSIEQSAIFFTKKVSKIEQLMQRRTINLNRKLSGGGTEVQPQLMKHVSLSRD